MLDAWAVPPHVDVLFVGAHPDDEYQSLSTFGQWRERLGLTTGVVTITRGEGGGNAAGPEKGAALGRIREAEEREAVAHAGIRDVFYLDRPDFWYTLSAPLTARAWGPGTLRRLVETIRATRPSTVVTMDPRPFNQHGGHQLAARLAVEAFRLAADPAAFPGTGAPWRATRLLTQNWGLRGPVGPGCATAGMRDPATGLPQLGVWAGAWSPRHRVTWAQRERDAERAYRTQGFAARPAKVTGPFGCDWFSVVFDGGRPVPAPVVEQAGLRPLYAEFRDWARATGLPWLANRAQPDYPEPPATTLPVAGRAPKLDGLASPGEYAGPALPLAHWEGERCPAADCAATARLTRHGADLYVQVEVTDEARGAALDECERHWRTDAVEIALDPRGDSDDTSTTFKLGVLPYTAKGGPCAARDADARQGPAPRVGVASAAHDGGYGVEVRIPFALLPAPPTALRANVLVYDSDTGDRTGQTRLAWSPFGSAQADPYVWGRVGRG
ncbi:sugar-binding protein [Nonomuraea sp. NPDC049637]|uniref:sugar-binding protein n=1 Tax=Nonomuraea sp. NPDC049637 TaxID=3154356 RepID=UPI00344537EC